MIVCGIGIKLVFDSNLNHCWVEDNGLEQLFICGTIRIPIQTKTKTPTNAQEQTITREDFFIHGGAEAGNAGCIDLWKNNDIFF